MLPIWEGTTNVLALDLLRTVNENGGIESVENEFERCSRAVDAPRLQCAIQTALDAFQTAAESLRTAQAEGSEVLQAGARRFCAYARARHFARTLGHAMELAYTTRHAQWSLEHEQDGRSAAAAERMAAQPINHLTESDGEGTDALAREQAGTSLFERYDTPKFRSGSDSSHRERV